MSRATMSVSIVMAFLIAVSFGMLGQTQETRKEQKSAGQMALRAKSLLGATVQLQGNQDAGKIEDIVFDDEGVIDYFVVSSKGGLVSVPWEAAQFNFEKRTAVINLAPDRFQKIPTYTAETYPNFYAPAYQTEIYGYYNLTPGQARRFERRMNRK